MKFLKFDLGRRGRGETVVVSLTGDSVNVRLIEAHQLTAFKEGRLRSAIGGHVSRSPYRVVIPRDGHWLVTIDRGGYSVSTQAKVRVEQPRGGILPPAQSAAPSSLADVGRNLAAAHASGDEDVVIHDVFISHASEDKEEVARPLCDRLVARGLTVWLDEIELRVGAHLRRGIDRAVATSRYGVVLLSPRFFAKQWTQYELDGLVAREMNGEQLILPIWHNLTKDQLLKISPSLADRVALSTAAYTLDEIADQLVQAVREVQE